jgi:hypothetical protein
MRWEIAYSSALVLGILSIQQNGDSAHAFVAPQHAMRTTSPLFTSNLGWDNENFLEALGKGNDERDDANEKYYKQSKFGRETWSAEGDMDKSERHPPRPPAERPDMNRPAPPGMSPENLSVEEQARLFREMKQQQEQQGPGSVPPPPRTAADPYDDQQQDQQNDYEQRNNDAPPPKKPFGNAVAADGRRFGRNRDADAVVNTADVYFAQLKRDSNARNSARYRGDDVTANSVFKDPSIKDIKMHVNPHLEEIRKKEQEMIETAADEMLEYALVDTRPNKPKGYSGVSYKDKISQFKNKKSGGAVAPPVAAQPAEAVVAPPAPVPASAPPIAPPAPAPVPMQAVQAPPKAPEPVMQAPPVAAPPVVAPAPVAPESVDVNIREGIRALMGMLLKHRGGSGFGPGRLTGGEINSFDMLATDISAILRDEARNAPVPEEPAAVQQMASVQAAQQATAPAPAAVQEKSTQPTADRVNGMFACMEGAMQMYKHSPPELQEGVLATLRAALLSAVNTCNDIIAANEGVNPPAYQTATSTAGGGVKSAQPTSDRINGMFAVMDGAIQMYKYSPPELQESVLVTLRAALLSAVSTCNDIIANNEVANVQAYQTATSSTSAPVQEEEVGVWEPAGGAAAAAAPAHTGTDTNSQVLEQVYNKLKAASGDGKMGLRQGLDPNEASELADGIAEMRSLLVGELDTGIPEPTASEASTSPTSQSYQELLAKARAEKEAKNNN